MFCLHSCHQIRSCHQLFLFICDIIQVSALLHCTLPNLRVQGSIYYNNESKNTSSFQATEYFAVCSARIKPLGSSYNTINQ